MPDIHIVSPERHGEKFWTRHNNYLFAASDMICPIVAREVTRAMMCTPIAFIRRENGDLHTVMLQGIEQGKNLLVSANGLWQGRYLPEKYRSYPFLPGKNETGELVLCIDESSSVISNTQDEHSHRFFDASDLPSESTRMLLADLASYAANENVTKRLCSQLQQAGLIEPWPLHFNLNGKTIQLDGLFRIDEQSLNALTAELLVDLRNSRALMLAYCQLLSSSHINGLLKVAQRNSSQLTSQELDFGALGDDGTLTFENL